MNTMNEALHLSNEGVNSMSQFQDRSALKQLLTSLRILKTALFEIQESEQNEQQARNNLSSSLMADNTDNTDNTDRYDSVKSDHEEEPSFHIQNLPGLSSTSSYLCSRAIGFTDVGMRRMASEWRDAHISSAIATFNAALLHHQQGIRWKDHDGYKYRQWLQKAKGLYKVCHSLVIESPLVCQEIRDVAWYLKISTIYNLSQVHRELGDQTAAYEGFQYLAWIVHMASPDVCQDVLGDEVYESVLQNTLLYSLSLITAPAA